jgi:hypothetical protein
MFIRSLYDPVDSESERSKALIAYQNPALYMILSSFSSPTSLMNIPLKLLVYLLCPYSGWPNTFHPSDISGSHGDEREDNCFLDCCIMWSDRKWLTVRMFLQPPSASPWWWRQKELPKRRSVSKRLYGEAAQKTIIFTSQPKLCTHFLFLAISVCLVHRNVLVLTILLVSHSWLCIHGGLLFTYLFLFIYKNCK